MGIFDPLGWTVRRISPRRVSRLSTELIRLAISPPTTTPDPTTTPIEIALTLILGAEPTSADWVQGTWDGAGPLSTGEWIAYVTIGPGGAIEPDTGDWVLWTRLTTATTQPVITAGSVIIE